MRSAISVTLHRDGGHADDGLLGKPFLKLVISRLALDETEPPAVTVDHNRDMVRIIESLCAAIEGGVIKIPLRRSELPDQLREVATILVVASSAAFGGEIELVPPFELGLGSDVRLTLTSEARDGVIGRRACG
jgi:hypothetical protein